MDQDCDSKRLRNCRAEYYFLGASAQSVEFRLGVSGSTATLQFGIDASPTTTWQGIYGSTNINTGNWVHVAVVKNGTTSTLYINGVSETSGTISGAPTVSSFEIGNLYEHSVQQNRYFPGSIDEVRLWSTARTQTEIQNNMYADLAGTETGLTHYYKMSNGSGTTLTDNKSSGNCNGTLNNGVVWQQPGIGGMNVYTSGNYAASYSTLKGAFDAINAGTHTGEIAIKVAGSTTETATAVLYQSGFNGTSSYTSVNIYPTLTGLSITGNRGGAPVIDLNGADNVVIDGRVNGAGSADMTISNSSTLGIDSTSTIRFINDASTNTVRYCYLKGSQTNWFSSPGGIVLFASSTGTTGNDGNTIEYNKITNTGGYRPVCAVTSLGTSGKENSGNIISQNQFYDLMYLGSNIPVSINIYSNSTQFTISSNSFYETAPVAFGNESEVDCIFISNTGTGYTISNNSIGGSASNCSGTLTKTNATRPNTFHGIYLNLTGGGTADVYGNQIGGISWSNTGTGYFYGIRVDAGTVNIGSPTGNIIGSASGTGSLTVSYSATGGKVYGIICAYNVVANISNNTIGSITAANSDPAGNTDFWGIRLYAGGTISNNTIGNATTANSINVSSTSTGTAQTVYGIKCEGTGTNTISGNTIANLTNGTTNTTAGTYGLINGICAYAGTNTIQNNTVRDLTIANASTASDHNASVIGIVNKSTSGAQSVTGNTIYNLSNTYATFSGYVSGLYYAGPTTASTVSKNFIHSITVSSNSNASIYGILTLSGSTTYSNNIISLGGNTASVLYGIYEYGAVNNNNNLYFNTVYIGGAPTSGANTSYAFCSSLNTNTRNFRNNIMLNARSNAGTATGTHYALYCSATGGTLTCDYNDYYVSGSGGKLGYYGGDITTLPIVTGQDVHSVNTDPSFANAGGLTAPSYKAAASLTAVTGTGITTDYSGRTRSGTPKMGAFDVGTIYVKYNASGLNTGASWTDAYTSLQSALANAASGDEIWVAAGTYNPSSYYDRANTDARNKHFRLINGVKLYGGFAGTESAVSQRVANTNETILSGDLSGDDTYSTVPPGNITDNCYHIIYDPNGTTVTTSVTIDGFTFKGGNASLNTGADYMGGAIYSYAGTFNISNCTFTYNTARRIGGALCLMEGFTGTISNSTLSYNCVSTPSSNTSEGGGAIYSSPSAFTVSQCTFSNNKVVGATGSAGAWFMNGNTYPSVKNCTFTGNSGGFSGGAVRTDIYAKPALINCLVTGNSAQYAGGFSINSGGSTITNCSIALNSATGNDGGAFYIGGNVTFNNSIIWGNTATGNGKQLQISSGTVTMNYSCYSNSAGDISSSVTASNCITSDPQFVGSGSYAIKGTSPCADAGNDSYNSETDDIRGSLYARKLNKTSGAVGTIDMGAYEYKVNTDPLPVELNSFTASAAKKGVTLNWKTATEVNNYGFEVERREVSDRHLAWTKIGFVEGNGTTNAPKSYSFTDKSANGKTSYRLKQIDRDGKFVYSQTTEVTAVIVPKEFALEQNYPNPFNPTTAIGYQLSANGHTTLKIYDAIGREVSTLVNEVKEAGTYSVQFDGAKLSSGIYFAKLSSDGKTQMKKLLLMK